MSMHPVFETALKPFRPPVRVFTVRINGESVNVTANDSHEAIAKGMNILLPNDDQIPPDGLAVSVRPMGE